MLLLFGTAHGTHFTRRREKVRCRKRTDHVPSSVKTRLPVR